MSYYKYRDIEDYIPFIIAIVLIIVSIIVFICIPKKGYMKVDSTHWYWYVDVYEYKTVTESTWGTEEFTSQYDWFSERTPSSYDMERSLPAGAYAVSYELKKHHSYSNDKNTTTNYYRFYYTYDIDKWVKIKQLPKSGKDKNPCEPDCDLPTVIERQNIGDLKRQSGHTEEYSATGEVDGEIQTVFIPKWAWERLTENDEFSYKKSIFGKEVQDIQIAE